MPESVSEAKFFGGYRVNWTGILGISVALFLSVGFWAAVINTTAALVK